MSAARFAKAKDATSANRRAGSKFSVYLPAADANALYRLLEEDVVPAFYERDGANIPRRWLATVKEAMRSVAPRFCARRMVKEYVTKMYAPAMERRVVAK